MEGHLRAKEVLWDPPASLPYQERIGRHLERDQETLRYMMMDLKEAEADRGRPGWTMSGKIPEDLKEKNIDLTRIGEATRNREVWRNLVRASSSAR